MKKVKANKEFDQILEQAKINFVKGGGDFYCILNPTDKIKMAAIEADPENICRIKNPSEKMQLLAVKSKPNTIRYIINPTTKVKTETVKNNPNCLKYIKNPTNKLIMMALELNGYDLSILVNVNIDSLTEKSKKIIVQNSVIKDIIQ
jgi:hypothetical protein